MRCLVRWIHDPWRVTNGGSLRVRAFLEAFVAAGHEVTCTFPGPVTDAECPDGIARFGTAAPGGTLGPPGRLRRLKRELLPVPLSVASRSRPADRGSDQWDLCLSTELWLLPSLPPSRYLWVDHSDLLSRLARTAARQRRLPGSATARMQGLQLQLQERRWAGRADIVTTAGWSDQATLERAVSHRVTWLPTPLPQRPVTRSRVDDRVTIGFLGDFAHGPNRDALRVLSTWLDEGFAEGAQVLVAGHGSDSLHTLPAGVEALGPVPSPDDFYSRVDLVVCPVRTGGGMKVKAIEALLARRPVVVHPHVLEGFPPAIRRDLICYRPGMRARDLPPRLQAGSNDMLRTFELNAFRETVNHLLTSMTRRD